VITLLALSPALDVTYLLDEFTLEVINRPTEVIRLPGGKAINAARAIAALGSPSVVIAPLGGHIGDLLEALLVDSPLALTRIDSGSETRSCVTVASAETRGLTELYEPASPISERALQQIERTVADLQPSPSDWLALSGSVPPDIDLARLTALMTDASSRGFRLAIDTHGAALDALVERTRPDLVKVNRSEAAALLSSFGTGLSHGEAEVSRSADISLEALAAGIRQLTGGLVIVTDGVAGSFALDESGGYRIRPDAAVGRFPVGSGDCFLGGVLAALDGGESFGDALTLGAACANANAASPGAAVFDKAEVRFARSRLVVDHYPAPAPRPSR
jgi:1-phosphofructokinase family hexose kinase